MIILKNVCKLSLVMLLSAFAFVSCGDDDDTLDRDAFIGTYDVVDDCDDPYVLVITASTTADDAIIISNLWDWEEDMNATVSGSNLTLPSQVSDGETFSGTGSLSESTLTIEYTVDGDDCIAVCTKQ